MSEQVHEHTPPPSRAELIQQAWEASEEVVETPEVEAAPAPEPAPEPEGEKKITKESLDEKAAPVAPSIREFLRAHKPKQEEPSELQELRGQVSELTAALEHIRNGGNEPEAQDPQALLLQKLEQIEQREQERVESQQREAAETALKERHSTLKAGVIANLEKRKEDYPATFALGQQEGVVNELFSRLEADDQDASDFSVASEYEASLVELYQKLHAVLGTKSEEPQSKSESPTLTNALTGTDTEESTEGLSRQEIIARAWAKANS